jgi:hypothetical protein
MVMESLVRSWGARQEDFRASIVHRHLKAHPYRLFLDSRHVASRHLEITWWFWLSSGELDQI